MCRIMFAKEREESAGHFSSDGMLTSLMKWMFVMIAVEISVNEGFFGSIFEFMHASSAELLFKDRNDVQV